MQRQIKAALRAPAGSFNKPTLQSSRLIMGKGLTGLWWCLPALVCLLRLTTAALALLALEVTLCQCHDSEFSPWGPSAPSTDGFLPFPFSADSVAQALRSL